MAVLKYFWLGVLLAVALATALWPALDIVVTAQFYNGAQFPARGNIFNIALHEMATGWPPKILFGILALGCLVQWSRRRDGKPWLLLLACLVLGPGLVANTVFKDMWGRARPAQITEFGGKAAFKPYWLPSNQCTKNCSFVNGDGSLGFMLAAPALVVARRQRLLFWSGTAAGVVLGGNRIMMGAHFLSDTVWAALLMLAVMLALHVALYGRAKTAEAWRTF